MRNPCNNVYSDYPTNIAPRNARRDATRGKGRSAGEPRKKEERAIDGAGNGRETQKAERRKVLNGWLRDEQDRGNHSDHIT